MFLKSLLWDHIIEEIQIKPDIVPAVDMMLEEVDLGRGVDIRYRLHYHTRHCMCPGR